MASEVSWSMRNVVAEISAAPNSLEIEVKAAISAATSTVELPAPYNNYSENSTLYV